MSSWQLYFRTYPFFWSAEPWILGHGRSPSASKDEVPLDRNGILRFVVCLEGPKRPCLFLRIFAGGRKSSMCSAKFLGSLQCPRRPPKLVASPTGHGEMGVVFPPLCQGNWWELKSWSHSSDDSWESWAGRMQLVWCAFFGIKNNMVSNIRWHPCTEVWRQISPSSTAGNRKACFLGPGSQIFHDASTARLLWCWFSDHVFLWQINMQTRKARHLCTRILLNAQGLLGWSSIAPKIAEIVFWVRIVPQFNEGFVWPMKDRSPGFFWVFHHFAGGRIWMVSTSWIWSPWRTRHSRPRSIICQLCGDFLCWNFRPACEDHSKFPCWPMLKGEQKPPQGCSLGTQMLELPIFPSGMGPLLPCDCKTWEGNVHITRFLNGGWTHNTRREPEVCQSGEENIRR